MSMKFSSLSDFGKNLKQENRHLANKYGANANEVKRQQLEQEEFEMQREEALKRKEEEDRELAAMEAEDVGFEPKLIGKHIRTWDDIQLEQIGIMINQKRRDKGMSQSELSSRLKLEPGILSGIENGKVKKLDALRLKSFAFHLGFDFDEFLLELKRKNVMVAAKGNPVKRKSTHTDEFEFDNYSIICDIGTDDFTVSMRTNGQVVQMYKGKKFKNNPFFEAMSEAIKTIQKTI